VGVIMLAAFSHCSYRGMEIDRVLTAFSFEPPGCTFSATFPEPPELKEQVLTGGLVMSPANF